MNCVSGLVPALPVSPHPELEASCHVALPEASLVRTYPLVAPEEIRIFWNAPVQATSRRYDGLLFPIPIDPLFP